MLKKLHNPCIDAYKEIKKIIFQRTFNWHYADSGTGLDYYIHVLLHRHEIMKVSYVEDHRLWNNVMYVVNNILEVNNFTKNYFYLRAAVNSVHSNIGIQKGEMHHDHYSAHQNIILYLSNVGGRTFVEDEEFEPQEDDVLLFEGLHCMERPKKGRRVAVICTIFNEDLVTRKNG